MVVTWWVVAFLSSEDDSLIAIIGLYVRYPNENVQSDALEAAVFKQIALFVIMSPPPPRFPSPRFQFGPKPLG